MHSYKTKTQNVIWHFNKSNWTGPESFFVDITRSHSFYRMKWQTRWRPGLLKATIDHDSTNLWCPENMSVRLNVRDRSVCVCVVCCMPAKLKPHSRWTVWINKCAWHYCSLSLSLFPAVCSYMKAKSWADSLLSVAFCLAWQQNRFNLVWRSRS